VDDIRQSGQDSVVSLSQKGDGMAHGRHKENDQNVQKHNRLDDSAVREDHRIAQETISAEKQSMQEPVDRQHFTRQQTDIQSDVEENVNTPGWQRAVNDVEKNIESGSEAIHSLSHKLFESFNKKYNN
jgi:hypothetical protein